MFEVLTTQEEYERELAAFPEETATSLDFANGVVHFASYGQAGDSNRSIEIESISDRGRYLEASVHVTIPFNCDSDGAISNPYDFVYVEMKKLVLVVESLGDSCP